MLLLQPVVAALAGWIVLGERLGPRETLGGALLLTGLAIARRRPERTEPGKGRTSAG